MKKKLLFIVNPISGVKKKGKLPDLIEKHLDDTLFDYSIKITEHAGHGTELARQAVAEGVDVVVSVGGDGSINEIGRVLMDTEVALGVIPLGSGNGLARHLNIPRKIKKAIAILNGMKVEKVDVGTWGEHFFFSNIGWGFVAAVVNSYSRMGTRGFLTYAYAVIRESLFTFKPFKMKYTYDGTTEEHTLFMLNAFNANEFGYGVTAAPEASLQDGLLHLAIVKQFPKWKLPLYAFYVLSGRPDKMGAWQQHLVKKVTIHHQGNQPYDMQVDGEPAQLNTTLEVGVKTSSLNIIVP